jgi:probable HAF family extracellular repeat protein
MLIRSNSIKLAALVAATISSLAAQGTFTGLGANNTIVTGMSGDGSIIVGTESTMGPAFRWTKAGGVQVIGSIGAAPAISRDGSTIISDAKDAAGLTTAAIWMGGTNWKTLGGLPGAKVIDQGLSSGYAVSGDGSAVVGLAWVASGKAHGFRWDAQNGMVDLGSLQADSSRANAISADGNVIGGWDAAPGQGGSLGAYNYWRGVMWWQGLERLMNPFGFIGAVQGINNDGSVLVGRGCAISPRHAYRFTAFDGQTVDLGALKRGHLPDTKEQEDTSIALAVSDDGLVVVGYSGYKPPLDAFIYTEDTKMVKLSDYLTKVGVAIPAGWVLQNALAITPDGKSIAGTGINPAGGAEGFVVTLP